MNVRLSPNVSLGNSRISEVDSRRQEQTAASILERFDTQPGVILADEVGMGKTFVALAVAYSVLEANDFNTQVVVMVPNSVKYKWPREWRVFQEKCLPAGMPVRAGRATVRNAVGFLKKLDDPIATRDQIIFATHNALTGQLQDPFVRLAILGRVLMRPSLAQQRRSFPKFAGRILRDRVFYEADFVERLLEKSPLQWKALHDDYWEQPLDDDPVPASFVDLLHAVRFDEIADALAKLPLRSSSYIDERLTDVRRALSREIRALWSQCLSELDIELPLLVLDEAHHLKNPDTKLAQILSEGVDDEGERQRGALAGVFQKMLFLTATPFQLGHQELIEILHRFEGVRWPDGEEQARYRETVANVEQILSNARIASYRLDETWGRIRTEDIGGLGDGWWQQDSAALPERLQTVVGAIERSREAIREAEDVLRPWVIPPAHVNLGHRIGAG